MKGLDAWITSGRYDEHLIDVRCKACGHATTVKQTTEYGMSEWEPSECSVCRREFDGDEAWEDASPPEVEYDYQDREDG